MTKRIDFNTKQKTSYCVETWLRDEQIRLAIKRPIARVQPVNQRRKEPIAVVGFAPSLQQTWKQIKKYKYVISCSGAHKFLVDKGIVPTYHLEVDPREHKVKLIGQPQKETEYLIASTCHPKVFDHLEGYNVKLWHVFDATEEGKRLLPHGEWAVTGGCDAGLRAMAMAAFLGFRNLHMFGMDGNASGGAKHAADHPNKVPEFNEVEYPEGSGKLWYTTGGMLEAAKQVGHEMNMLPLVKFTFHGKGLIQTMYKNYKPTHKEVNKPYANIIGFSKPELISEEYRALNAKLHAENLAYGVGGGKHAKTVKKLSETLKTTSVLDYGCQPLGALVLTPSGWKKMGEINKGDQVIGGAGKAISVIDTHEPGVAQVYRVSFNDGTSLVVDGAHLWSVRTSNHQRRSHPFTVKRTKDLIGDLTWPNAEVNKWRIPMAEAIEFAEQPPRFLHPYLLGLLLGDGNLSQGCAKLFAENQSVVEEAERVLPVAVGLSRDRTKPSTYRIVGNGAVNGANPVTTAFRDLGLWDVRAWEKFIPERYLYASPPERVELLQGLMDTDGEVRRHHLSFSTTSPRLAGEVAFLVQGLGGTARISERSITTYEYKGERRSGRKSYVVHLKVPRGVKPTRAKPWIAPVEYLPNRVIESISIVGECEVKGLTVEADDQLYVTENCIVTHNCGKGYLSKALPFPIWEYDPAIPAKADTPRQADIVVCADVLEHIEADKLDFVLDDLRRVTKKVGYFVIHTGPSMKKLPDGRNAHLLQHPKAWWEEQLGKYFEIGRVMETGPLLYCVLGPKRSKLSVAKAA
jgi:uncharacterized Rossmann fold enzyme